MISTLTLFIVLNHLILLFSQDVPSPVVDLQGLGKVQGTSLVSRAGRNYFAFLGIPFGSITRRFEVANPAGPWDGILNANETSQPCCQYSRFSGSGWGVEDCLSLNVETPDVNGSLPVIVWIHPGGFQNGGANFKEQAGFIIDEDVVFVVIQYRLGAFGFLDSTDGTVAGNFGLKDQVLALKWVQQHIASFGGNPWMVTIAGVSAGAAFVNYHLLSPMSQGLFHRGIMISGSSLNPWALQTQPKELFQQLLVLSNCTRNATEESVQCLRDLSSEDLLIAQAGIAKYPIEFDLENMHFVPSVESLSAPIPKFIDTDPLLLMQDGKIANPVPILTGTVNNEGLYFSALLWSKPESIDRLQKEWNQIAPNMLYLEEFADKTDELTQAIRQFYFDEKDISTNTFSNISNILGDRFISNGVADTAILLSTHMPVYAYLMNYTGNYSLVELELGVKGLSGVSHADELLYFYPGTVVEGNDVTFSKQYVKLLASFVKTSEPTDAWGLVGQWDPVDTPSIQDECPFYELTLNEIRSIPDPFYSRRLFWQTLLAPVKTTKFVKEQTHLSHCIANDNNNNK